MYHVFAVGSFKYFQHHISSRVLTSFSIAFFQASLSSTSNAFYESLSAVDVRGTARIVNIFGFLQTIADLQSGAFVYSPEASSY